MRPIWTGSISFGLINIPVRLYSATNTRQQIDFDMLHAKDLSPIRYAKVCKEDGEEVSNDEIVKGVKVKGDQYVVLDDEDFEKANVTRSKSIEITGFIEEIEIDDIYFEKPYLLEPEETGQKAYVLLRDALERSEKVGLAKFVMRGREHMSVVKASDNGLMLVQLRYQNELRTPKDLDIPEKKITKQELDMALMLVDKLAVSFRPSTYRDSYHEELTRIIAAKAKGQTPRAKGKAPEPTNVRDIMTALRKSLDQKKSATKKSHHLKRVS